MNKRLILILVMSLQLMSLTYALAGTGRILKGNTPIAGLALNLGIFKEGDILEILTAKTDTEGSFDFGELKGGSTYFVSFVVEGKTHRWILGEGSSRITIGSGIKGKLFKKDGTPIAGSEIGLADEVGNVDKTTSDTEGNFVFGALLDGKTYTVNATFNDVDFANTLAAPGETTIMILDVTTGDLNIAVDDHEIVIQPQEGMLDVTEFIVYVNRGDVVYNNDEIYVTLPKSRKLANSSLMDCCFKQDAENALANPMKPLFPGDTFEVRVNYKIPIEDSMYSFQKEIHYPTKFFGFFVLDDNNGLRVAGDFEDMEFAGRRYKTIISADVSARSSMSLEITGLKTLKIETPRVEPTGGTGFFLPIGAGILILLVSAIAIGFPQANNVLRHVIQRTIKGRKILFIALLLTLAIHFVAWGYGTIQKGEDAKGQSQEAYEKAIASEDKSNPCIPPEGYTEETWREHMSHHPKRYKECL